MALTPEIKAGIKSTLEQAEHDIASIQDVINDLRASGIDASSQEQQLQSVKSELRKLQIFYGKQKEK